MALYCGWFTVHYLLGMPTKSDDNENSDSKNFMKLPNFQVFTLEREYTTIHKGKETDTFFKIYEFSIYLKCLKGTADIVWMYDHSKQYFSHNYYSRFLVICHVCKIGCKWHEKNPTETQYEAIMCFKFSSCTWASLDDSNSMMKDSDILQLEYKFIWPLNGTWMNEDNRHRCKWWLGELPHYKW